MDWKSSIAQCDASWTAEQEPGSFEHEQEATIELFPIPSPLGHCNATLYTLPLGSTMGTFTLNFHDGVVAEVSSLMDVHKDFNEPTLIIIYTESGNAIIDDRMVERQYTLSPDTTHIQFGQYQDYHINVDTKQNISNYKLIISKTLLQSLMGKEVCEQVLEKLKITQIPADTFIDLPPKVNQLLKDCASHMREGAAESLAIQGKVLIFLSALASHVLEDKKHNTNKRHINIAKRLHDEVIAMQGRISTLAYFADKYGLSTKSLNESFKAVYDQTIWSFILEHRLQQAHTALAETDIAIKTIADKYGYANVSHFSNAFKNKYGYPPGQLRKS